MNKTQLTSLKKELAKTIVKYGLNLPNTKIVRVFSTMDDLDFTNMVIEECYKSGVKRVLVDWIAPYTTRLHYLYGDKETLATLLPYEKLKEEYCSNNLIPRIILESETFGALNKCDVKKVSYILNKIREEKYKNASNIFAAHWTGFFMPSVSWAKKLFPKLKEEEAIDKCWEIFLKVTRVEKNKTIKNWKNHLNNLLSKAEYLNSLNIDSLHYTSKNGTDLTIGLTNKSFWIGGAHKSEKTNKYYNPNFPTEEVFTTPHRLRTEGVVYSTKPLCVAGKIIEGIRFKFKKGRIVEIHADKNEKLLKTIIEEDENCRYLGECALVPYSSLINKALPLFYSTIYDENASCHLAFGLGFDVAYRENHKLTRKELIENGVNYANNHIDFMIGSKDLNIVATLKNKKKVVIFKNGEWAK